jgi:IS5 family transposase
VESFPPSRSARSPACGAPPRQAAADGGYASRGNLKQGKARGVQDVAFHKKCGIAVADMVNAHKSPWVYRRRRNFRAGIEAGISCFKRAYGGARCTLEATEISRFQLHLSQKPDPTPDGR